MEDIERGPNEQELVKLPSPNEQKTLVASFNEELVKLPRSPVERPSIFRVHEKFQKISEYAYIPEVVSIGPFHHKRVNVALQVMEVTKLQYMNELLLRKGNRKAKLQECFASITKLQEMAGKCYSGPIDCENDQFSRMMIVDGLFIIELFLRYFREVEVNIYDDPILSNKLLLQSVTRDLILLENQLPMLVLDQLFTITRPDSIRKSLKELAIRFFNPLIPRPEEVLKLCSEAEGLHLLDLVRVSFYLESASMPFRSSDRGVKHVPCVTELRKAGIKFKASHCAESLFDLKFEKEKGILEIPPLVIHHHTDTHLRNLIACEQYCDGQVSLMSSYAFFMDSLIDSQSDVEILRTNGIFRNSSDESVTSLFHKLCQEVCVGDFHYAALCDDLNKFYDNHWNIWFQDLREYFHTPWKATSILVAALIVLFTVGGFICDVLSLVIPS